MTLFPPFISHSLHEFTIIVHCSSQRFEKFKHNPAKFAVVWFMQAVWIYLTALPVYIVLANPSKGQRSFGPSDIIGVIIWLYGFIIEVTADTQKFRFKSSHPRDFINTGIWRYSRYANYYGEVCLHWGIFILCARGVEEDWQWVAIISPIFVFLLIYFVSGVKLAEKAAEEKYGEREGEHAVSRASGCFWRIYSCTSPCLDYKLYKAQTSKFLLWPQKSKSKVINNPR